MVIGNTAAAALQPPRSDRATNRFVVGRTQLSGACGDEFAGFEILEPGLRGTLQHQLGWIHDVKHQHLMPAVPQELQCEESEIPIEQHI